MRPTRQMPIDENEVMQNDYSKNSTSCTRISKQSWQSPWKEETRWKTDALALDRLVQVLEEGKVERLKAVEAVLSKICRYIVAASARVEATGCGAAKPYEEPWDC